MVKQSQRNYTLNINKMKFGLCKLPLAQTEQLFSKLPAILLKNLNTPCAVRGTGLCRNFFPSHISYAYNCFFLLAWQTYTMCDSITARSDLNPLNIRSSLQHWHSSSSDINIPEKGEALELFLQFSHGRQKQVTSPQILDFWMWMVVNLPMSLIHRQVTMAFSIVIISMNQPPLLQEEVRLMLR